MRRVRTHCSKLWRTLGQRFEPYQLTLKGFVPNGVRLAVLTSSAEAIPPVLAGLRFNTTGGIWKEREDKPIERRGSYPVSIGCFVRIRPMARWVSFHDTSVSSLCMYAGINHKLWITRRELSIISSASQDHGLSIIDNCMSVTYKTDQPAKGEGGQSSRNPVIAAPLREYSQSTARRTRPDAAIIATRLPPVTSRRNPGGLPSSATHRPRHQ